MCLGKGTEALSRMGILFGFISLVTILASFVGTGWVYTNEPYRLPNLNLYTTITFRIGLWRICHTFKRINSTIIVPMPSCTYISYTDWMDINYQQLGLYNPIEFTLNFVSKIRWSTVFSGFGLLLLIIGVLYSILGHCYQDNKNVIASAIYTLSGLSLSLGLFVFVCMLTGAFNDFSRYQKVSWSRSMWSYTSDDIASHDYRYGWCFFAAGISCALTIFSAMCAISAHYYKYQMTLPMDIQRKYFVQQQTQRKDKSCLVKLSESSSIGPRIDDMTDIAATSTSNHNNSNNNNINNNNNNNSNDNDNISTVSREIHVKPDIHVTFVGDEDEEVEEEINPRRMSYKTSPETLKCNTLPNSHFTRQYHQHHHHHSHHNRNFATLMKNHRFLPTTTGGSTVGHHRCTYSVTADRSVHPTGPSSDIRENVATISMNDDRIQSTTLKINSDDYASGGSSNGRCPLSRQLQSTNINNNNISGLVIDSKLTSSSDSCQRQLPINEGDCHL